MADAKITDLADGGAVQSADEFVVARAGANKKIAGSQLVGLDGWVDDTGETWTYVSATSFKVSGVDVTAKYTVGTRIKLTQTTVKYFVVTASSFSTDTTVTITGGSDYTLANAAISANYHSYAANPQGYPGWFTYDSAPTGFSGTPTQRASRFSVIGRVCHVYVDVFGTSNATTFTLATPVAYVRSFQAFPCTGTNSGSNPTTPFLFSFRTAPTSTIDIFRTWDALTAWTASGSKSVEGSFFYEI